MTQDKKTEAREFWVYKGRSNFCQELIMDSDYETMVKQKPEGFYDVVSTKDTVEGGIHVIEYSAYQKLREENEALKTALEVYAMTKETFPEYGNVAKEVLAKYPRGEK